MKETFCLIAGVVCGFIAALLGGWDSALATLVVFMGDSPQCGEMSRSDRGDGTVSVTVNEYLLTKHNPYNIDMPSVSMEGKIIGVTINNTSWITTAAGTTPAEQYTRAAVNGKLYILIWRMRKKLVNQDILSLMKKNAVFPAHKSYAKGEKITLNDAVLYVSATAASGTKRSGSYYIYDRNAVNGRYRITTKAEYCVKTPAGKYVTGWVNKADML